MKIQTLLLILSITLVGCGRVQKETNLHPTVPYILTENGSDINNGGTGSSTSSSSSSSSSSSEVSSSSDSSSSTTGGEVSESSSSSSTDSSSEVSTVSSSSSDSSSSTGGEVSDSSSSSSTDSSSEVSTVSSSSSDSSSSTGGEVSDSSSSISSSSSSEASSSTGGTEGGSTGGVELSPNRNMVCTFSNEHESISVEIQVKDNKVAALIGPDANGKITFDGFTLSPSGNENAAVSHGDPDSLVSEGHVIKISARILMNEQINEGELQMSYKVKVNKKVSDTPFQRLADINNCVAK